MCSGGTFIQINIETLYVCMLFTDRSKTSWAIPETPWRCQSWLWSVAALLYVRPDLESLWVLDYTWYLSTVSERSTIILQSLWCLLTLRSSQMTSSREVEHHSAVTDRQQRNVLPTPPQWWLTLIWVSSSLAWSSSTKSFSMSSGSSGFSTSHTVYAEGHICHL